MKPDWSTLIIDGRTCMVCCLIDDCTLCIVFVKENYLNSFVMWASPKNLQLYPMKRPRILDMMQYYSTLGTNSIYDLLRQLCMKSINQITARCTTQLAVNNTKYDLTFTTRIFGFLRFCRLWYHLYRRYARKWLL